MKHLEPAGFGIFAALFPWFLSCTGSANLNDALTLCDAHHELPHAAPPLHSPKVKLLVSVLARPIHSTLNFAMTVISRCVTHVGSTR